PRPARVQLSRGPASPKTTDLELLVNQTDPTAARRDAVLRILRPFIDPDDNTMPAPDRDGGFTWHDASRVVDRIAAVVAPPTDRAAWLAAADEVARWYVDSDTARRMRDGIEQRLRRLAVEAHDTGTPQPEAEAPDELATARATNQRLNYEKQRLESELATYRRAVRQWDVSERGTYIPHSSLRVIGKACGVDILGSVRHLKHFERVEQAEAAIERVRQLHDRLAEETDLTSPDDSITRGAAAERIAAALDGWTPPAPVAQQPAAEPAADLIEDYLKFLRDQGPEPDLSKLPAEQREAITGQFEVVKALADRDAELPPLAQDPVARRLGLQAPEQQPAAADGEEVVAPHCDGFPSTCPNPIPVPPAPPYHDGGFRCGCYDTP
ncbi:hypothetical protein ACWET9_22645, partial [Streptomyces sp. NPDC004059]